MHSFPPRKRENNFHFAPYKYTLKHNETLFSPITHDLKPYSLPLPDLTPLPIITIFNNTFHTISTQGFIKHSLELESIHKNFVCSFPHKGTFHFEVWSPLATNYLSSQFKFKFRVKCNGVFSYLITNNVDEDSNPAHLYITWFSLLPPVTLTRFDYVSFPRSYPRLPHSDDPNKSKIPIPFDKKSYVVLKFKGDNYPIISCRGF